MDEISSETRWLTYTELAEALGISREAAQRRVSRSRWARLAGNDGRTRVAVPETVLTVRNDTQIAASGTHPPAIAASATHRDDLQSAVLQRDRAIAELREAMARLEGELAGAQLGLEHMQDQVSQARRDAADARAQLIQTVQQAELLRREADEAWDALRRFHDRGLFARMLNRKPSRA